MRPLPHSLKSTPPAAARDTADAGGDAIDRALRLGASAIGCPLIFTPDGSVADAGGGRSVALPARSFEETHAVLGADGEALGTVRAVDLASRPNLDDAERSALADVAGLIASDIGLRQRLGESDTVTGMPNRRRFERDFDRSVKAAGGDPVLMLVTLADARKYGEVLRALGHVCAETFVRAGGEAVRALAGRTTLVCHVSVLSFALMIARDRAEALAREFQKTFAEPIMCGQVPIATKIGVGLVSIDGPARPAEVLRSGLVAAQDSRLGDRGFAYYDPKSDAVHVRAFSLLTDLDEALRDYGQLSLAYQPRIDLKTGRAVGAEALVRWKHPLLGAIPPSEFVPLAETTALMGPLTDLVMTKACRQAAAWRRDGLDLRVSVNVSPTSLCDPEFLERADRIIDLAGADPAGLEFEFTEGTFMSPDPAVRARIDSLRERGIKIAIDDFGMGYSNLDSITRMPADVLKIDRSLVMAIDDDPRRRRLCQAMIELAQDLDFHVVAEGIETSGIYDMLAEWRCDEGQGYFMSRPLPAADFAAFAASR